MFFFVYLAAFVALLDQVFGVPLKSALTRRDLDIETDPLASLTAFLGGADELEALYRLALAERALLPDGTDSSNFQVLPGLENDSTKLYNRFDSDAAPSDDYVNLNVWISSTDPADMETQFGYGVIVKKFLSGGGDGSVVETPSRRFEMLAVPTLNETSALGNLRVSFGTIPLSNTTLDGSDVVDT
ncbi:hypothetical protein BJ742DRAFT_844600 [Cladochytrium replicatum]|nr:hypothetical protein BJ742DRAFT_844600 [Cladochytrium replicatum]